jgi:hypothetical protein
MKKLLWRHKVLVGIWLIVLGIVGYGGKILFAGSGGVENPYVLSEQDQK